MNKLYILLSLVFSVQLMGQSNEDCLACHLDNTLTSVRNNRNISLFVNERQFSNSVHGELDCVDCHQDFDPEDLPHLDGENIYKVDCSLCHDEVFEKYQRSLHGIAHENGKFLAPECFTCHSKHNIQSSSDDNSRTHKMNIPSLCGECHKDGTPVSTLQSVSQRHILEDYSESIHGEGLLKRGLIVTAVCTDCHDTHNILPHESPESSINRTNIPKTCMQCHRQIEKVHTKVIRGEMWENQPHVIPVCVDCHQPHKVRRVFYQEDFPNNACMECHSDPDIHKVVDGEKVSLFVDPSELENSVHKDNNCVKCHTNVTKRNSPVCLNSGIVDCTMCHVEAGEQYELSHHAKIRLIGNEDAPTCTGCHDEHLIKGKSDPQSPIYVRNIPDLCGKCHQEGHVATVHYEGEQHQIIKNYKMSLHGKGLIESGLLVTATCVSCHTNHRELPATDPLSSIHKDKIAETCGTCHQGIYNEFQSSIHSQSVSNSDEKLPTCNDCHLPHSVSNVDQADFRQKILFQCGKCHEELTHSYFDTFHGKVSNLGAAQTAKCHDCHGAHNILPPSNIASTLNRENVVETCKTCHPNSNRKFVGYLTHATHHDRDKYPYLYYTFWFMTILLVGTFSFFGLHTLLWLPRAFSEKRKHKRKNTDE
ncbi:MAG: hypothetical protein K9J16_01110 [Melioribacteraceae bacterium]|nr:hypothetical protein [Melioribacteraceae bacterium]MCF8356160.1 hypothetical protein [Melioribacteraceae bacterium]MCF8392326.1 hypothetical protein [Melioribacteraceae bacterium]MCF8417658.1 hypothetical protein [Melioribacteraceae bacterium]